VKNDFILDATHHDFYIFPPVFDSVEKAGRK
jgi:hypothetical protein